MTRKKQPAVSSTHPPQRLEGEVDRIGVACQQLPGGIETIKYVFRLKGSAKLYYCDPRHIGLLGEKPGPYSAQQTLALTATGDRLTLSCDAIRQVLAIENHSLREG